jgi:hypothetical protein
MQLSLQRRSSEIYAYSTVAGRWNPTLTKQKKYSLLFFGVMIAISCDSQVSSGTIYNAKRCEDAPLSMMLNNSFFCVKNAFIQNFCVSPAG